MSHDDTLRSAILYGNIVPMAIEHIVIGDETALSQNVRLLCSTCCSLPVLAGHLLRQSAC